MLFNPGILIGKFGAARLFKGVQPAVQPLASGRNASVSNKVHNASLRRGFGTLFLAELLSLILTPEKGVQNIFNPLPKILLLAGVDYSGNKGCGGLAIHGGC